MARHLMHQTTLVVNILIEDETGTLTVFVFLTTKLLFLLWQTSQVITAVMQELSMLLAEAKAALEFTGKVLAICLSALAYGLGMKQ